MTAPIPAITPAALDWIKQSVTASGELTHWTKIAGSTSADLFRVSFERRAYVLRLFTNAEWLKDEPDLVAHEAGVLNLIKDCSIPVPELVACDEGSICGWPAVLMTEVPGQIDLHPADFDAWLGQMAAALNAIHSVDAHDFAWSYYSYNNPAEMKVPQWSPNPANWEKAIEIVNQAPPPTRFCLIHRDYHPMNTLWQNGRLSGIIDWVNACRGPAPFDLAWNRVNLMSMYGVETANRLRDLALAACGDEVWHPYWDLMALIELLPDPPRVYPPWLEFGLTSLTPALTAERTEGYLASLLQASARIN